MPAPEPSAALIGLGMIGRHHARLLRESERVTLLGAVDPGGDRFDAIGGAAPIHATIAELLDAGTPDMAIVAVPTELHLPAVTELAAAGVSVLVEKPVAASAQEARELIEIVERAGVRGAVGHVERYNPALLELRRRLNAGQIGEPFLLATERIGPFPGRIRDVGVVKDLATHDLDLLRWLSGSAIEMISAQTAHRAGREHEDLVVCNGRVASGLVFSCTVDWLTPAKSRRVRVLGELGMLEADLVAAELTFSANGHVTNEWDQTQAFKGVSEGDVTRYALARREPLLLEHEAFVDLVAGDPDAPVVSLADGLAVVHSAEAVLASAGGGGEAVRVAA